MGSKKRPKLATRYSGPRSESREMVSIAGRCRIGEGEAADIAILDLDAGGCRVRGIGAALTKSDPIELWLGQVGPVCARLRWAKRGLAGLRFDQPLSAEQIEQAVGQSAEVPAIGTNVIALRRRATG